jgi:hypothetical protein
MANYPEVGGTFTVREADNTAAELTITTGNDDHYILFMFEYTNSSQEAVTEQVANTVMYNEGNIALPYEPYGWLHSLRKQCTATETIQSGDTIYADGTAISTYTIKGNTTQSGTPSPSNPVDVNGVGERTEQLVPDISTSNGWRKGYLSNGNYMPTQYYGEWLSPMVSLNGLTEFTISAKPTSNASMSVYWFDGSNYLSQTNATDYTGSTFDTIPSNATQLCYAIRTGVNGDTPPEGWWTMLNSGSTAKPYEPYGYKIPISNNSTTTPIYLGSVQSTRRIEKIIYKGSDDENWSKSSTGYNGFYIAIPNHEASTPLYCNMAQYSADGALYRTAPWYCVSDWTFGISTDSTVIGGTTIEDWKAYLATLYANGTPLTIWHIRPEVNTIIGIVNEPLLKISDVYDIITGSQTSISIPTTDGANTITVDTTVQPSEFTATWTGWHDASVKEWDGTDWQ